MARYRKINGEWYNTSGSSDNYSTEEQVIGTWIDGKPIYRKVLSTGSSVISLSNNTWKSIITQEIDIEVLLRGDIYQNNPSYPSLLNYISIQYSKDNGQFMAINTRGSNMEIMAESSLIIEYTKTTD